MTIDNLVSVILPVYNAELYLEECLESLLSQTYSDFELVIVNDGSSDCSPEIISNYKTRFERLKLIERENKGLVYSLNEAIRLSSGRYIVRMDADDICEPSRILKQVNFMLNKPEVLVSGTRVKFFSENAKTTLWRVPIVPSDIELGLVFGSVLAHPSVIIDSRVFKEHGIWYEPYFKGLEDYRLWSKVVAIGKVRNLREPLLRYRRHSNSVTVTDSKINPVQRFRLKSEIRSQYFNKFSSYRLSSRELELLEILGSNKLLQNSRGSVGALEIARLFIVLYLKTDFNKWSITKAFFSTIAKFYFIK